MGDGASDMGSGYADPASERAAPAECNIIRYKNPKPGCDRLACSAGVVEAVALEWEWRGAAGKTLQADAFGRLAFPV